MIDQPQVYTFRGLETLQDNSDQTFLSSKTLPALPLANMCLKNNNSFENNRLMSSERNREIKNDSDSDDSVEVQQIEGLSKKQTLLTLKIYEFQKICLTLTKSNKQLLERIDDLQNHNNNKNNKNIKCLEFNQESEEIQNGYEEIQGLLKEYKKMLIDSQSVIEEQIFQKQRINDILKEEIERLNAKNAILQKRYLEMEQKTQILKIQCQAFERQLRFRYQNISSDVKKPWKVSPILTNKSEKTLKKYNKQQKNDNKMHLQLQFMIDKLCSELQREKNTKQNLKRQIIRLTQYGKHSFRQQNNQMNENQHSEDSLERNQGKNFNQCSPIRSLSDIRYVNEKVITGNLLRQLKG